MSARTKSLLYTKRQGDPGGTPWLLLHDRHGDLPDAEALGAACPDGTLRIAVRAPRLQTSGATSRVGGFYWYFGPIDRPELSTLGDALYQLEIVLLEAAQASPTGKAGLIGKGEGGAVALLMAQIWPDKIEKVIAIDANLPTNLDDIPFDRRELDGLNIEFRGTSPSDAITRASAE